MRILLADDQPRVCSALRLLLEQESECNIVHEVANGQELMDYLADCCPDVLLLDWELPGTTPEKLLTRVRASCPRLVVIVLSSEPQARRAALEAGANGFVGKNDPPERLLSALKIE